MALLAFAWLAVTASTAITYWCGSLFIRDAAAGQWNRAFLWVLLEVVGLPIGSLAGLALYKVEPSWWSVEFPYWAVAAVFSLVTARGVLHMEVGWREGAAAALMIVAAYLLAGRN